MFEHILAATDGSNLADQALETALALRRDCGGRVTVLMVVPDYNAAEYATSVVLEGRTAADLRQKRAEQGARRLDAVMRKFADAGLVGAGVEAMIVVHDEPHAQILEQAERRGCDLIVMASRGNGTLRSALLGSQTLAVLSSSRVPVLVVRQVKHPDIARSPLRAPAA